LVEEGPEKNVYKRQEKDQCGACVSQAPTCNGDASGVLHASSLPPAWAGSKENFQVFHQPSIRDNMVLMTGEYRKISNYSI
jgi:hypothetical protein